MRKKHALQLFKTDMCKFYLRNRCENGDTCSYAHNFDEVRSKPDLTATSMCKNVVQFGSCRDLGCRFAHTDAELRATYGFFKMKMCGFAQSGRCKHGAACRFAHTPEELRPVRPPPPPGVEGDSLLMARQQLERQVCGSPGGSGTESLADVPPMPASFHVATPPRHRVAARGGGLTSSTMSPSEGGSCGEPAEFSRHSFIFGSGRIKTNKGASPGSSETEREDWASWTSGTSGNNEEKGRRRPSTSDQVGVTTLLVTNVPTMLTQGALLSMFEDLHPGMRGHFDFFYCPWDETSGHNLGYAIFNFPEPEHAAAFQQAWSSKELCRGTRGQKGMRVLRAALQGRDANAEYFSKVEILQCSDKRFRPLTRDVAGMLRPLPLLSDLAPGPILAQPGRPRLTDAHFDLVAQQSMPQGLQGMHSLLQCTNGHLQGQPMAEGEHDPGDATPPESLTPQFWGPGGQQDEMQWPVMMQMAAVPMPMSEQVPYPQMVQYMMMPMEAMVPVEGGYNGGHVSYHPGGNRSSQPAHEPVDGNYMVGSGTFNLNPSLMSSE